VGQADNARIELGRAGEHLAERFLHKHGLKTVVRRFSTPVGELDLVMRDGDTIVFVEVKTRRDRDLADPQDAVNLPKQRRMTRAARWFIQHRRWDDKPCRFDIVAVLLPPGVSPEIEHFRNAFLPPASRRRRV
jgi:putative endonuclease